MQEKIANLKKYRSYVLKEIASLSAAQLHVLPEGSNNNILWNLGHLIAASQLIFYKRAGLELTVPDKFITPFLTGTFPAFTMTAAEIAELFTLSISTLEGMEKDYREKDFSRYVKSENIERVYHIEVLTIDDAIDFLMYHEGYHVGKIMAIKTMIGKMPT